MINGSPVLARERWQYADEILLICLLFPEHPVPERVPRGTLACRG